MTVLPERTVPPAAIARVHAPPRSPYPAYRACLRWEFAFTCAFCLSHEADLFAHGAEGSGLFWIEHRTPRSDADAGMAGTDDYANCYLSCRYCNRARDRHPIHHASGRRLLDPCVDAWSDHFRQVDDDLLAAPGDRDAEYTRDAYDINDPRKRTFRSDRQRTLALARRALREIPPRLDALARRLENPVDRDLTLGVMRDLQTLLELARRDFERFVLVPPDAPRTCPCDDPAKCSLPRHASRWLQPADLTG